jgi:hypothetical protein
MRKVWSAQACLRFDFQRLVIQSGKTAAIGGNLKRVSRQKRIQAEIHSLLGQS